MFRRAVVAGIVAILSLPLPAQTILALKVEGPITPAAAEYILRGIETARDRQSPALLIRLNTPGGLLSSTRTIVSAILESPVPVIVYVAPGGAQAGSAGVFITLAGHVAAMAPGTNIGAAHPVGMQGAMDTVMSAKATNDAAAFVRAIAQQRHRNLSWAENAVRNSVALSAAEALDSGVVDMIAASDAALLDSLHGRAIPTGDTTFTLSLRPGTIEDLPPNFAETFLGVLSDPNIAYILFLLGLYGLLFELYNPGSILPGVVGGICIILALYAFQTLPFSYAGVALIVFAILLFLLEVKVTSHGVLAIGGTISLLLGSAMLIRPTSGLELVEISWSVILFAAALTALFFLVVIGLGLRAQRARPASGSESLVGRTAVARTAVAGDGTVEMMGELWNARTDGPPIAAGSTVVVEKVDGLKLIVSVHHRAEDRS